MHGTETPKASRDGANGVVVWMHNALRRIEPSACAHKNKNDHSSTSVSKTNRSGPAPPGSDWRNPALWMTEAAPITLASYEAACPPRRRRRCRSSHQPQLPCQQPCSHWREAGSTEPLRLALVGCRSVPPPAMGGGEWESEDWGVRRCRAPSPALDQTGESGWRLLAEDARRPSAACMGEWDRGRRWREERRKRRFHRTLLSTFVWKPSSL